MKTYYYENENDDLVYSKNQNYKIKDNFKYKHTNIFYIAFSYILYWVVLLIAFVYCKIFKGIKYVNRNTIKDKTYYMYSNHVLTYGDILNPFLINFPRRPYIICSEANLGIPIIGKLLPMMGAIVIPSNFKQMKEFLNYIKELEKKHPIIIYPEAHLWPYYTKIRGFGSVSFNYPVSSNKSVYSSTTTFQKINNRLKIIIYVDGPYEVNRTITRKEIEKELRNIVYNKMIERSRLSNYEYVKYYKKNGN